MRLLTCGFLILLFSALPAFGASPAKPSKYLEYRPSSRDFDPLLSSAVSELSQAVGSSPSELKSRAAHARELLSELSVSRGLEDERLFLIGFASELLGDNQQAVRSYAESLNIRKSAPLVRFRLAEALRALGNCSDALTQLKEIGWLSEEDKWEVGFARARCLADSDQKGPAIRALEDVQELRPDYRPASDLLLKLRVDVVNAGGTKPDDEKKVREDLTALLADKPSDSESGLVLAKLLIKRGDPLLAAEDLKKGESLAATVAEQSHFQNDAAVRLLVDAQIKRGDLDSAERNLIRGLAVTPASTTLLEAARQLEIEKEGKDNTAGQIR